MGMGLEYCIHCVHFMFYAEMCYMIMIYMHGKMYIEKEEH